VNSLIRKVVREELEIKEKGIEISRLQKLQPRNYLAKRVKSAEKEAKTKPKIKELENEFLSTIEQIKNLNWTELRVEDENQRLTFYFPREIEKKLKSLATKFNKVDYSDILKGFDKRLIDFVDADVLDYFFKDDRPYISYEYKRNRTHFPDGLPSWLKGLNLGLKMYRKALNELKYIQSEDNASQAVQKIYTDLIQFTDVNCILVKENAFVIEKSLPKEQKQKLVAEYIFELYKEDSYPKFKLNKTIIFDSSLLSQLGKNNVEKLIDYLFKFKKKNVYRDAWEDEGQFGKFDDSDSEDENDN